MGRGRMDGCTTDTSSVVLLALTPSLTHSRYYLMIMQYSLLVVADDRHAACMYQYHTYY